MNKFYNSVSILFFTLLISNVLGQTNPTAQSLPYSQNFASLTGSTTTYPAGWQGWTISGSLGTSYPTSAPNGNQALAGTDNTSTSAHVGDFNGKMGTLSTGSALKAICLAINTSGLTSISVSFDAGTQRTENTRQNELGLQYRIGTSGAFTNVSAVYQNQMTPTNTTGTGVVNVQSKSVTLPAACENQAVVQLRWVIRDVSGSGNRPGFSIDNISVTGSTGCTAPTTQATNFDSTAATITTNSGTITWTRGNGDSILVVARASSAVNADPASGTTYTANSVFGSGSQIGTGNYVVYKGTGTSVNVTGLSDTTTYHFALYEYNTTGTCYNLSELTGNFITFQLKPNIVLNSANPAVAANNIIQGTSNNVIYAFDLSVTTNIATLTGVTITTSGTYAAANLTNLKCWYSTNATFEPTDSLLSTKTTSLGAGTHIFPSFTSKTTNPGLTRYLFITTDLPCSATSGNTIIVNAITTSDLTFAVGNKSGSASAGGTQTILTATPNNVTAPATSACADGGTTVSWTAPAGCSSNVLVFAKAGSFTSAIPTGNGGSYTANTVFGSGTAFDGGFCVYKGTGTTVSVTGLTNGTNYTYKIFTRNDINWSAGATTNCTPTVSIPDDGCSTNNYAELTIPASNSGLVTDINVGIKISHLYRGDLKISLVAPDNTEVLLINQVGAGADNLDGIIDDSGTANGFSSSGNHTVDATYDVTAQPEGAGVGTLASFNGKAAAGNWKIRVCDNAGTDVGSIVSAALFITSCASTASVSSFLPTTGPASSIVTISGSGFTGATGVKFNGVNATSYTVINNNTISAEVPANATTGKITVMDASSCGGVSSTDFTVLSQSGSCGGSFTDLFISEVYDSDANNVFNVEIFNPSTSAVTLDGVYSIAIKSDNTGSFVRTVNLTGTIAGLSVYTAALGTSAQTCTYSYNLTSSGSGINALDGVYLLKNSADLDISVAPNETGYSLYRLNTATGPTTTYNSADWTVNTTESCSGIGSFTPSSSITITANPTDVSACSFFMSVTATGSGLTYQWKFNDSTSMSGWNNVTTANLTAANAANSGVTVSGATTNTLTLTGDLTYLYNYQFYCEITSSGCTKASNGAQFRYDTKPVYRTVSSASGNWTTVANWEMSTNYGGTWTAACTYPIAQNSTEIYIEPSITLTLDKAIDADYLEIKSGGTLKTTPSTQLTIHNGNASGADFKVLGTYEDNSNGSNSLVFSLGTAKWEMGSNGTVIKTNLSSADVYRDGYQGGMVNMPATAIWIYRNDQPTASNNPTLGNAGYYYPNLYFENPTATAKDWSNLNSTFRGNVLGNCTVYGSLYVGVSGQPLKIYNNNLNATPMVIYGNMTIGSGSELTIHESSGNAGAGTGTGFDVKGNVTVEGTLDANTTISGILRFSGSGTQVVSGAGTMDLYNVDINKPTQTIVDLDRNIDAKNNLNFNSGGIIKTDAFVVTASNPGRTTGVTGYQAPNATGNYNNDKYVYGSLERAINTTGIYDFPVGDAVAGEAYNPTRLDIITGTGNATAKFVAGAPGTITVPKTDFVCSGSTKFVEYDKMTGEGWWNFTSSTSTTFNYNMYLHPNILNVNTYPNDDTPDETPGYRDAYRALKAPSGTGGGTWPSSIALDGDPCVVGTYYEIPGFNYTGFSDAAPGGGENNSTPLPIELLSFNAYCNTNQVDISWSTASELNNDYFTILKSNDGVNYSQLGIVDGAGSSNTIINYSYTDGSAISDLTYYKLIQTDYDGKVTSFPAKTVICDEASVNISVFMNTDGLIADIYTLAQESYQISVYDATAKRIVNTTYNLNKGYNRINIEDSGWANGMYIVVVQGSNANHTAKVMKQ